MCPTEYELTSKIARALIVLRVIVGEPAAWRYSNSHRALSRGALLAAVAGISGARCARNTPMFREVSLGYKGGGWRGAEASAKGAWGRA